MALEVTVEHRPGTNDVKFSGTFGVYDAARIKDPAVRKFLMEPPKTPAAILFGLWLIASEFEKEAPEDAKLPTPR